MEFSSPDIELIDSFMTTQGKKSIWVSNRRGFLISGAKTNNDILATISLQAVCSPQAFIGSVSASTTRFRFDVLPYVN